MGRLERLAIAGETVAGGLWHGVEDAAQDAWQHKGTSALKLGTSAVVGAGLVLLQPEAAAGKLALEVGSLALSYGFLKDGVGVVSKTWSSGINAYKHPENAAADRQNIAKSSAPFLEDFALASAGGALGAGLGSSRFAQELVHGKAPALNFEVPPQRPEFDNQRLQGMFDELKSYHPTTYEHSQRVAQYSDLIAQQMGFSASQREVLNFAAITHDIGKLDIPLNILDSTTRLSPEDMTVMQSHAEQTLVRLTDLVKPGVSTDIPEIAALHHENFDGSGYFRGVSGEEIPKLTRVITVADVFDAMTSARSYKPRSAIEMVQDYMLSNKGSKFDPEILDALMAVPAEKVVSVLGKSTGWTAAKEFEPFKGKTWEGLMKSFAEAQAKASSEGNALYSKFKRIYETPRGN